MAKCTLCGHAVLWAKTAPKKEGGKGASMPLELPPNPNGNAWIVDGVVQIASADNPPPPGARRYSPHFVNCVPYATQKRVEKAIRDAAKTKAEP